MNEQLSQAVRDGDAKAVRQALQRGADPNLSDTGQYGRPSMLHLAVFRGDAPVVAALLKHGASVAARDASGRTALSVALDSGEAAVVALLAMAGAEAQSDQAVKRSDDVKMGSWQLLWPSSGHILEGARTASEALQRRDYLASSETVCTALCFFGEDALVPWLHLRGLRDKADNRTRGPLTSKAQDAFTRFVALPSRSVKLSEMTSLLEERTVEGPVGTASWSDLLKRYLTFVLAEYWERSGLPANGAAVLSPVTVELREVVRSTAREALHDEAQRFHQERKTRRRPNPLESKSDACAAVGPDATQTALTAVERDCLTGLGWHLDTPNPVIDAPLTEGCRSSMLVFADRWREYGIGFTPLHFAAASGRTDAIRHLCELGADIEAGTRPSPAVARQHTVDGNCELCAGCGCERSSSIWATGANANDEDEEAYCNFAWCLEQHGGVVLPTPLHLAVAAGHLETVAALLDCGADLHAQSHPVRALRTPWRDCGCTVSTPLHWAAKFSHHDIARLLLERGASPNACGSDDWDIWAATVLQVAVMAADREMTVLLLRNGADANRWFDRAYVATDDEWSFAENAGDGDAVLSPLHWAASRDDVGLAQILLEKGADVNITADDWGPTPLDCALSEGKNHMVEFLRARGARADEYH